MLGFIYLRPCLWQPTIFMNKFNIGDRVSNYYEIGTVVLNTFYEEEKLRDLIAIVFDNLKDSIFYMPEHLLKLVKSTTSEKDREDNLSIWEKVSE